MKNKYRGIVFLQNLTKPLGKPDTKVCSIKDVCGGVPLPNNRQNFYQGVSACIGCMAKKSKERWAEKKKNNDLFMG